MENKKNERQLQINRLQQNLSSIRKIAGWSAETLGNKIGVTKQTISNLENKKTPMTFTQYIAIRAVLDAEIETNKDNEALPKVISILLDSVDSIDDIPTRVLVPSFVISELRTAFIIGFLIYLPFIVIDMVVSSTLMSMGMMMLPPTTISTPFKILLFVMADGWNLIIGNLMMTFK